MILVKKGLKLLSVLMIVLGLLTLAVGIMTTGVFVLSGETTLGQAKAHEIKSDAIFDDCGVILDILKGGEAK